MMGVMQHDMDFVLDRLRAELAPMRGLWREMDRDLLRLGITSIQQLRGKRPEAMANAYRALAGHPPDPILRPYFAALIDYAETGVPTPWWHIMRAEAHAQAC